MVLSERLRKQASEFMRIKGQQMLQSRKIPGADVRMAYIIINEMESGYMDDSLAARKINEIMNARLRDSDIKKFWDNNISELETILMENV